MCICTVLAFLILSTSLIGTTNSRYAKDFDFDGSFSLTIKASGTIARQGTWTKNMPVSKDQIEYIFYRKSYAPTAGDVSFDISGAGDDSVMAYYDADSKTLNICPNGDDVIYLNPDSSNAYSEFTNLITIEDKDGVLDSSQLQNTRQMFYKCSNLETIKLPTLNTQKVSNMIFMFGNCTNLTRIDMDLDTSSALYLASMFQFCTNLTEIDTSLFDTSSVVNMRNMFRNCSALTVLDLSSFDTRNVADMALMFMNCSELKTIFVSSSFVTDRVDTEKSNNMFGNCKKLVGGNGTSYNATYLDKTYARIDSEGAPGYFTAAGSSAYIVLRNTEPTIEQQPTQEATDPVVEPTETANEDTTVSGGDATQTEQPSTETPAEETTPTEETTIPEDTTSGGEDNGSEPPTEEPAPAGDEVPTDTDATE